MTRIASGMQEPVGIGAIGLGRWGELHVAGYDALPHATITFATCVRAGTPPAIITPADAYRGLQITPAIVESATMERDVTVDLA